MAWGLATAISLLNDALQSRGFGLACKLYETKPLSDLPVFHIGKERKAFEGYLYFCLIVLRPTNNTAKEISLAVIEFVSSPAKRSFYITRSKV